MNHFDVKLSCGVFDLDWIFFGEIFGINITYLIILIQLKDFAE